MVRKKEKTNFSISKDLLDWLDVNTSNKSSFVEGALRDRIKKVLNPQDALKQEINYHDKKAKEHQEIKNDLEKQLAIKNGKLKLVDAVAFEDISKKAERLDSIQSYQTDQREEAAKILEHAPLTTEVRNDGTTVGKDVSKEDMRKKAMKIIETPDQEL